MYGGYGPQPIYNPPVPSDQVIAGGMKLGQIVVIQGFIPHHASKTSVINLKPQVGSDNDINLHMSIRFHENCIVRNTKQGGRYGSEERGGGLPLGKGQNFHMLIAVHPHCFKVSINGRHFADYNHRTDFQQIAAIGFSGEFQIQAVSFQQDSTVGGSAYPPSYPTGQAAPPAYSPYPGNAPLFNPPVPYSGPIPGGLYPGRMITIQGTVNPSPTRFHVNLMLGGDIALHFNPRFKENCIVRNTKSGGKYGSEERQGPGLPLSPNTAFDLKILVEPNVYKIALNNQHYCEYNHRLTALYLIQGLEVGGDVRLSQIYIQ